MSERANAAAFPRPASNTPTGTYMAFEGLTIREHLAGQALIGVMALNSTQPREEPHDYPLMASHAVYMADCLLLALESVTHEDRGPLDEGVKEPKATGPTSVPEGDPTETGPGAPEPIKPEQEQIDPDGKGKASAGE